MGQPHLASSSPIRTFTHVDFNVRVFSSDIDACSCTLFVRTIGFGTITVGTITVGTITVGTITVGTIVVGVIGIGTIGIGTTVVGLVGVGAIGVGARVLRLRLSVMTLVTPNISIYYIRDFLKYSKSQKAVSFSLKEK